MKPWLKIFALLAGFSLTNAPAEDFLFASPYGSVTFSGDGPVRASLFAETGPAAAPERSQLSYTEAVTLPAFVEASSALDDMEATARAEFAIEEKADSGLYLSGRLTASSDWPGAGARAELHASLLLKPVAGVAITVSSLTSLATAFATQGDFFSLQLRVSDAAGNAQGPALFSVSGNLPIQQNLSYEATSAFYVLELTARAALGVAASEEFSFTLDFQPVPEPASGALLLSGVLLLLGRRSRSLRVNKLV